MPIHSMGRVFTYVIGMIVLLTLIGLIIAFTFGGSLMEMVMGWFSTDV